MELAIPRAGAVREASLAVGFLGAIGIIAANAVLHAGVVLAFIAGPLLVLFVLARPELGVWLVILLTPLEVIGPLSFSMSKAAKLALTLLVATALLLTRRKDGTNQPDSYVWPFALIVISGFFSSLLAASPLTSLLGLASIAIFVLSYTAVRRSAVLTGKGTLLLRVLIWSAVLLTPLCFLQLTTGYSGVTSAAAEAEDAFGTVWPGISRASAAFNGPNAAGAFFAVAAIAALTHAIVHLHLGTGICLLGDAPVIEKAIGRSCPMFRSCAGLVGCDRERSQVSANRRRPRLGFSRARGRMASCQSDPETESGIRHRPVPIPNSVAGNCGSC